jgi:hypothetical protein
METGPMIKAEGLAKHYGKTRALAGVGFAVPAGTIPGRSTKRIARQARQRSLHNAEREELGRPRGGLWSIRQRGAVWPRCVRARPKCDEGHIHLLHHAHHTYRSHTQRADLRRCTRPATP